MKIGAILNNNFYNFKRKKDVISNEIVDGFPKVNRLMTRREVDEFYSDSFVKYFTEKDSANSESIRNSFSKLNEFYFLSESRVDLKEIFESCFDKKTQKFDQAKFDNLYDIATILKKYHTRRWVEFDMTDEEINRNLIQILLDYGNLEDTKDVDIRDFIEEEEFKYHLLYPQERDFIKEKIEARKKNKINE